MWGTVAHCQISSLIMTARVSRNCRISSLVSHHCWVWYRSTVVSCSVKYRGSVVSWYRPHWYHGIVLLVHPRSPILHLTSCLLALHCALGYAQGCSSTDTSSPLLIECDAVHAFDLVDNPVQFSAIQFNPVQSSAIQCNPVTIQRNAEHWLTIRLIFYAAAATPLSRILDRLSSQSDPAQLQDHCSNLNCTLPYMHSYTELHS